jgi:hypothetical protein
MRIEQSRLEKAIRTVQADPANLLRIEAEIARLSLQKEVTKCQVDKIYYELVYLAGFSTPEELSSYRFNGGVLDRKPYPRALWVWNTKGWLGDEQSESFFISFCKIKGIKRVFLSLNRDLLNSLPQNSDLPNFII